VTLLRWRSGTAIVACIAAMLVVGPSLAIIQTADAAAEEEQRPINIDVRDMAIGDVLRMIGQAANVNIIVGQDVTGEIGSLILRNVSVETALRLITEAHGYSWRMDENVYVVSAKPQGGEVPEPEPAEAAAHRTPEPDASAQPPGDDVAVPRPPAEPEDYASTPPEPTQPPEIVTQLIPLSYMSAVDAAALFGGAPASQRGSVLQGREPHGLRRMPGGSISNDFGTMGVYSSPLGPYGMPQFEEDVFGGGGGRETGGLGGGLETGVGTRGGGVGRTTGGAGGTIEPPGEMQPPVAIMSHNALLVRGTREEIDEFREMLNLLDIPSKQVEISTKWIDVQTTAADALGIDWSVTNGAWELFNLGFAPGEAANNGIRYGRGRWWFELSVLVNTSQATVINEPRVVCMNGMPGTIAFETEIPYFAATISYNQFGQRTVDYTSEFVDVTNELYVVPQINPDDSVKMLLAPQLQDQVGTVEGPNGERIPIITSQYVETMVRVPDGETVVLGGVIRGDESLNVRKTPLLSEIPIIGKLFQSRRLQKSDTELLIFVTPKIVRDGATAE